MTGFIIASVIAAGILAACIYFTVQHFKKNGKWNW